MSFLFTQISKNHCQKSYNGFWGFLVISTTSQVFLIYTFSTMKYPFDFFEICTDMDLVSLSFLNEKNITTSLLMMHLKYTVVHYTKLNSSFKNKPFLNYGSFDMLFRFFSISYLRLRFLIWCSILQNISMSNHLVILRCDT